MRILIVASFAIIGSWHRVTVLLTSASGIVRVIMNIIMKITVRYMRKNYRRTAATIMGIILSVLLLTIVTVFSFSFRDAYKAEDGEAIDINSIILGLQALIVLLSSVLIYNSFAVSMFEKTKYMGMLGSVGATGLQKSMCVLLEGMVEAVIGIPIGLIAGLAGARFMIKILKLYLLGSDHIQMVINVQSILLIVVCAIVIVLLASMIPAWKAGKVSIMDTLVRTYPAQIPGRRFTTLKKKHRILGIEGAIALKNILLDGAKYKRLILIIVITLCVLLDGYVWLQSIDGAYYIKDERPRPDLSMWVELHTEDTDKIDIFYSKLKQVDEIKNLSLERTLNFTGFILPEEYVKKEYHTLYYNNIFSFAKSQRIVTDKDREKVAGYLFAPYITGVDEQTYQKYLASINMDVDRINNINSSAYPVIIDNYIMVSDNDKYKNADYKSVLNIKANTNMKFTYSKYGDLDPWAIYDNHEVDKLLQGEFHVAAVTDKAAPLPYYSKMNSDIYGYEERESGFLNIYMPISNFNQLVKDSSYIFTYGPYPEEATSIKNHRENKSIVSYVKFDIMRPSDKVKWSKIEKGLYHKDLKAKCEEDEEFAKIIEEIALKSGLEKGEMHGIDLNLFFDYIPMDETYAFGSANIWTRDQMLGSGKILLTIMGAGIVILICAFSLTGIFQQISASIRLRRKEFASLCSLGMTKRQIYKMVIIENSVYGIVGGCVGMPLSIMIMKIILMDAQRLYGSVEIIPIYVIMIQIVILILVIFLPIIHAIISLRNLNIIESIRNENT